MNIFLDTSSLFKLYHNEPGTEIVDRLFSNNTISSLFLSEIAKIEFASTVWKKVRTQEISESQAVAKVELFEADFGKYAFIQIDKGITDRSGTQPYKKIWQARFANAGQYPAFYICFTSKQM